MKAEDLERFGAKLEMPKEAAGTHRLGEHFRESEAAS